MARTCSITRCRRGPGAGTAGCSASGTSRSSCCSSSSGRAMASCSPRPIGMMRLLGGSIAPYQRGRSHGTCRQSMTAPEAPDHRARRRPRLRGPAGRLLRPARSAAASAPRGAARDRRHPDRPDRRPVPPGDPRARPQPGRRLPRHGEPAGAAQGADAAAPRRRRKTAGRIPAPSWCAGCWSTSRSARSPSGWGARPSGGPSSSPAATCRRRPSCRRRRSPSTCSSCCRRSSG